MGGGVRVSPLQAGDTCPLNQVSEKPTVKPREKLMCTKKGGQTKGSGKQDEKEEEKKEMWVFDFLMICPLHQIISHPLPRTVCQANVSYFEELFLFIIKSIFP